LTALEAALRQAVDCDDWLEPSPPMLHLRLVYQFAGAAASRAETFDDVLPGAYAVAAGHGGWQPLLALAFPPGWSDRSLTGMQREFLRHLVDNDGNWHPTYTGWKDDLCRVGLPPDRDACRSLTASD
jgi:hypothetical protein